MNPNPLMLEELQKYFPDGFPGIEKEVLFKEFVILITKDATPLSANVNLFIWDDTKKVLTVTENVFPTNEGMGTFCTNLWVNDEGKVMAYAAIGSNILIDPPTGKVTPIRNGRPW